MGATVYLVRHGETHWNRERRYQGWTDIGLNERGWLQAAALARRLRPLRLAAVYASGLRRAVETARAIAEPRRLQVQTMACFREMRFGDWEGLTAEEIQERFGAATYALWLQDPSRVTIPGGETLGEL
ncbi:MAG: histidine phosphatase family protein, partial [Syntrophomonadaceae bacterium]|nr:histidine phosphatase family protein [Syntrophomonadaceae bacterium]